MASIGDAYDPTGHLLAQMNNGPTLRQARVPLVGGAMAQYVWTGLNVYEHPDWLGTSRLESTPNRAVSADPFIAPFGEQQFTLTPIDTLWFTLTTTNQSLIATLDFSPTPAIPFVIQIDQEQMQVTDIGPCPTNPSSFCDNDADDYTITRGWNATTPAAHAAAATIYLVSAATGFTGSAFQDKASDLWDFPAREYHATQGRWISPDPAGLTAVNPANPQTWNRYAYVVNNPCSFVDPLGLDSCDINVKFSNNAGLSASQVDTIERRIKQVFGATQSLNGDSVGINFNVTGKADSSLTVFSSPSWFTSFLFGTPLGLQGGVWGSPRVYWNNVQAYNPSNTAILAGSAGAHELAHDLLGVGDLPYDAKSPNIMMFDSAPDSAHVDAIYNPASLLWRFAPSQVGTLFTKCKKSQGNGGTGGGGIGGRGPGGGDGFSLTYIYWQWYIQNCPGPACPGPVPPISIGFEPRP